MVACGIIPSREQHPLHDGVGDQAAPASVHRQIEEGCTPLDFSLAIPGRRSKRVLLFDNSSKQSQLNDWEPRENRGRLRHCDGLRAPKATGNHHAWIRWEGGSEVKPEVRIPV